MKNRFILSLILLALFTLSEVRAEEKQEELQIEDDNSGEGKVENAAKAEYRSDLDLPQFAGEKYVVDVTAENFEELTKGKGSDVVIVFFGAEWCPHCRNFKPEFNIMAHSAIAEKKFKTKFHFLRHFVKDNKEWAQKFKVEGYPTIIAIQNNKFWKYHGDRRSDKIFEWAEKLDLALAKEYPDHIPGFYEEIQDAFRDILQNVKIAYERDPTKMTYFFVALGGIFLLFLVCFIYAIYESCCVPEEEYYDERKEK